MHSPDRRQPQLARRRIWPGRPYPLGATTDARGTNFALFSAHATRVELCLFDDAGTEERIDLPQRTGWWWHGYVPGVGHGQLYGFRADGPYAPERGHRFNASKLVVDPYARAIEGELRWHPSLYDRTSADGDETQRDTGDSAPFIPKSVVLAPSEPPRARLDTPWHETVIYEAHVKGMTIQHPEVPPALRGTYLGLASEPIIDHLRSLGVTAIELLPIHHFVTEQALADRGLRDYWGYNTLGFFAPHTAYRSGTTAGCQRDEFRDMVDRLHQAGIEVILDVVYNHTAEGNHLGPTLSFRGLDNASYYRLAPDRRYYEDFTGTGNTLDLRHPSVLQLVMDSLRYWVGEMGVDGFRFDLASALARGPAAVERLSAFFDVVQQDPVIGRVKLIAEPWDVGDGGYQVGNFPPLWSEWNGKYRDTMRDFWRGRPQPRSQFGYRFCGSSDLYGDDGRTPFASVNYITAHDGFTLHDLVAYDRKHNDANGEANRDGTDDNRSWNSGAEGDTDDTAVLDRRRRRQRALLATLLLSHGVPMICGGDELGRTQHGNNNAYAQDNEISWIDWRPERVDTQLLAFARLLARFRTDHPILRRPGWFRGRPLCGTEVNDLAWLSADGAELSAEDWERVTSPIIGVFFNGGTMAACDACGERIIDDSLLIYLNATDAPAMVTLPDARYGAGWICQIASETVDLPRSKEAFAAASDLNLGAWSVTVLVASP